MKWTRRKPRTDAPPVYVKSKVVIRTRDSYLILDFYEHSCDKVWKQDEYFCVTLKDDPEIQEIETISLQVLDLDRNKITGGDVDEMIVPVASIVWMSTGEGCNYPPFAK
jgi:hypothetical protein